jgi:hypothetical protein
VRKILALATAAALSLSVSGLAQADPNDPCEDPNASTCPDSPNFDPWAWHDFHQGPTQPNDPTTGPICQNQVGDESTPPEDQPDGCILP